MPLKLIATPIGNPGDITLRAIEELRNADLVIGEETAEVSKLMKRLGLAEKKLDRLNEHSDERDIAFLLEECRTKNVALVSDCGTPGFCDPGSRLVLACRNAKIPVTTLPGASSLMCILSLSALNVREFLFLGFLPAEREARGLALRKLKQEPRTVVVMDTPYRMAKLMSELAQVLPDRRALLGMDLTLENETVLDGRLKDLAPQTEGKKAEFILLIYGTQSV